MVATVHYESFVDDEPYASGENMFGFLRKNGEWKLAFMQNTNIPAIDSSDYSEPFELNNSPEEVIEELVDNSFRLIAPKRTIKKLEEET